MDAGESAALAFAIGSDAHRLPSPGSRRPRRLQASLPDTPSLCEREVARGTSTCPPGEKEVDTSRHPLDDYLSLTRARDHESRLRPDRRVAGH